MELTLDRFQCAKNGTLGKLSIDRKFFCFTLEDEDRLLEAGGIKIPKETCIPRGRYEVIITYSNRFKRDMPLVRDVPQFEGIRIHNGSFTKDTEGCPLVGSSHSTQPDGSLILLNSRATFAKLFDLLEAVYERGEKIWISVL